jgi:hypothetical protein
MNQRGRDALVAAALAGQRQIVGTMSDGHGGLCAMGVLAAAARVLDAKTGHRFAVVATLYDLNDALIYECAEAACRRWGPPVKMSEADLVVHLNDHHRWDFLTIARKLGPEV